MRHFLFIALLSFICLSEINAQKFFVVDSESLEPLSDVWIHDQGQKIFTYTNENGMADLKEFRKSDTLTFQHPSYILQTILWPSLNDTISLTPTSVRIDEIVISASKHAEDQREVPQHLQSIDQKTIDFHNPQTSADLLAINGEVYVQKSQQGGGSPMLRGFAANSILLVIDGVRMNNAIYRGGNLQNVILIDANAITRSEVVFGAGSVIYGSDALGGVMHFHTKSPEFSNKGLMTSGKVMSRYATSNQEKTVHADISLVHEKWTSWSSISLSDFSDLRSGSKRSNQYPDFGKKEDYVERSNGKDVVIQNSNPNIQKYSGYKQLNLIQKLSYHPDDEVMISYAFHYTNSTDIPRYDRLTEYKGNLPKYAEWYYGPQRWSLHRLEGQVQYANACFDKANLLVSRQDVKESRHNRKLNDPQRRSQIETVGIWGINIDFEKSITRQLHVYYGLETYQNNVRSKAYYQNLENQQISPAETRYPDGGSAYRSYAGYVSGKYAWNPDLHLTMGMRYNLITLHAQTNDNRSSELTFEPFKQQNSAISGSFGIAYQAGNGWLIKPLISSGFRSPNIDDIGKLFSPTDGILTVPNPDLSPEYANNFELNVQKDWKNQSKWYVSAYYTFVEDVMVRRPFSYHGSNEVIIKGDTLETRALVNSGSGKIYGLSTGIEVNLHPDWILTSTLGWTKGYDQEGFALRHIPPVHGKTALNYKYKGFNTEFSVMYNGAKAFEDLAPEEQEKTHAYTSEGALSWYTLNLKASYKTGKFLSIQTGLENIMDLHYRPFASGISAPGRNFYCALKVEF